MFKSEKENKERYLMNESLLIKKNIIENIHI